jgi:tetratricopeptide (TPR) repeat protein
MDYNIFPLWYLLYVENRDEKMMPILYPYFHQDWVLKEMNSIIPEAKIDSAPSRGRPYDELPEISRKRFDTLVVNNPEVSCYLDFKGAVPPSYTLVPKGFVYQVVKNDIDFSKFLDENPPDFRFRFLHEKKIKKNWRIEGIIKEYSNAWKERGSFYNRLGRLRDGLDSYKKASELCSSDPEIYKEMAREYVLLEEYDAALVSYNKALKLNPVYADCFADLGVLYFKMGKIAEAVSSLKKALSINPEHSEAKRNLSLLVKKK